MSRTWLITKNNPDIPAQEYIQTLYEKTGATYAVGQLEKGAEGTLHVQMYLNFKDKKRIGGITKHDTKLHAEKVIVDNGAAKYCMKEETRVEGPWEFGTKPVRRNVKDDWDEVWENAKKGNLEKIPKEILVSHYSNIKKIEKDHMKVSDSSHLRGIWVYGKPGDGKSRWAREQGLEHYPKLCNKWWDGYQGQKLVIMDDIGLDHKCLGQQLKIWTDRYGCILETKGGAIVDNYDWFIVTSQYRIEDIWVDDAQTVAALQRRFKEYAISDIKKFGLQLKDINNP